jgi:hypothetical protein
MSRKADFEASDVGRENEPRKYIAGHPDSPQRGVWNFDALPRSLMSAPGDVVAAKLSFSTFRLAGEAPDVQIAIRAVSHTCPQKPPDLQSKGDWQWAGKEVEGKTPKDKYEDEVASYRAKKIDPASAKPGTDGWKAANELAEKFGFYECRIKKGFNIEEATIEIPAGLIRNALKNDPETDANGKPKRPLLSIFVKCESSGVMLGLAEPDLYLVEKIAYKK